jgi:hypothetical protein
VSEHSLASQVGLQVSMNWWMRGSSKNIKSWPHKWILCHDISPSCMVFSVNLYHTATRDINSRTKGLLAGLNSRVNGLAVC